MKKLFALLVIAGFVVASCGSNAAKEEAVEQQQEETTLVDSTEVVTDSTDVEEVVEVQE